MLKNKKKNKKITWIKCISGIIIRSILWIHPIWIIIIISSLMISPWFTNWYINRIWCDQQQTNKKIVEHVAISMLNESMTKHNWDSSQMTIDRQYLVESDNISWNNVPNRDRKWFKSLWLIKQFTGSFHMRAICIKIFVCCECESLFLRIQYI